jgi:hypothetical protein
VSRVGIVERAAFCHRAGRPIDFRGRGRASLKSRASNSTLTLDVSNAAVLPSGCAIGGDMNSLVERILRSYGEDVGGSREKLASYLRLLASTGKTDEQLFSIGSAYLKELLEPDTRYSGC